jgi:hypothetical protein
LYILSCDAFDEILRGHEDVYEAMLVVGRLRMNRASSSLGNRLLKDSSTVCSEDGDTDSKAGAKPDVLQRRRTSSSLMAQITAADLDEYTKAQNNAMANRKGRRKVAGGVRNNRPKCRTISPSRTKALSC